MSARSRKHTVKAISAHEIPERKPIEVRPGEVVGVGRRDTTWPAFVYVTAGSGEGWVPARHLDIEGSRGVVVEGYDTTELATSVGEMLEVVKRDEKSGWIWCRNQAGREGWVPLSTVDRVASR